MNLSSLLTLHRMQGKKKNSLLLLLPYHFWQRDDDDDDDHHSLLLREIHYFLQLQTCRVIDDCLDLASDWDSSSSSSSFEVQGLVFLLSSSPSLTKYWYWVWVACFGFSFSFCSYFCEQPRFDSSFITATYNRGRGPLFDIAKRRDRQALCIALVALPIQDWGIHIPSPIKYVRHM